VCRSTGTAATCVRSTTPASAAAAATRDGDGPVVLVFVFDEDVLTHAAPPRVEFMLGALASFPRVVSRAGSDVVVARGDPADVLPTWPDATTRRPSPGVKITRAGQGATRASG